jgi:hypothetical protein
VKIVRIGITDLIAVIVRIRIIHIPLVNPVINQAKIVIRVVVTDINPEIIVVLFVITGILISKTDIHRATIEVPIVAIDMPRVPIGTTEAIGMIIRAIDIIEQTVAVLKESDHHISGTTDHTVVAGPTKGTDADLMMDKTEGRMIAVLEAENHFKRITVFRQPKKPLYYQQPMMALFV